MSAADSLIKLCVRIIESKKRAICESMRSIGATETEAIPRTSVDIVSGVSAFVILYFFMLGCMDPNLVLVIVDNMFFPCRGERKDRGTKHVNTVHNNGQKVQRREQTLPVTVHQNSGALSQWQKRQSFHMLL
ncbi:hypothetical protein M378DRAFT_549376 [Amanita muscaria Koide BX008]|uniref:Uncharacterized protein n=1 Tax=Amanita muscaria (strain Koide BX008) TaxID=946122 RepID=A0A0C2WH67_AMAMK|nr:hypothetical protein M378DRAFT_549376 [Amanita muscaria Koide BX008]